VQPAVQHNTMVKKQNTEALFDVACREGGKCNDQADYNSKGQHSYADVRGTFTA